MTPEELFDLGYTRQEIAQLLHNAASEKRDAELEAEE